MSMKLGFGRSVLRGASGGRPAPPKSRRRSSRPRFEALEPRLLLAQDLYVTTWDDGLDSPGLSLRQAIQISNESPGTDTIHLNAGGTFRLLEAAGGTLQITDSVRIVGAETDFGRSTIDVEGPFRALHVLGIDIDVTLEGLVVRDGLAADGRGGGLLVEGARTSVTLDQTTFENNIARGADGQNRPISERGQDGRPGTQGSGGAVLMNSPDGLLTVIDSTFTNNIAQGGNGGIAIEATGGRGAGGLGGAFSVENGSLFISGSIFTGNEARGGVGGNAGGGGSESPVVYRGGDGGDSYGGAIASVGDGVQILTSVFAENRALAGSGFSDIRSSGDLRNSLLVSLTAPGSNGFAYGGAVVNRSGTLEVIDATFAGNVAAGGRLDLDRPFSGGIAGRSRVRGGDGGTAVGGAIEAGLGDLIVSKGAFVGNMVLGAAGGFGGGNLPERIESDGRRIIPKDGASGGDGGHGGNAIGAAISAGMLGSEGSVLITESLFAANGAIAGPGGEGGSGHANDSGHGGNAGRGGDGGAAAGTVSLGDGAGPYIVRDSLFTDNRLAAGDGGQGGIGGYGTDPERARNGGQGGIGGAGGVASGGGIVVSSQSSEIELLVERTTISANIVAGGWGGPGGHGADGNAAAGSGGDGGQAGAVTGAGLAITGSGIDARVEKSTVYGNLGVAGDGGNGGSGGRGLLIGGNGGRSGDGGSARGGGIDLGGGFTPSRLVIHAATIAANVLEAGAAGRGGYGGRADLMANSNRTIAYSFGGRLRSVGSTAIFLHPGLNPFDPADGSAPTRAGLLASATGDPVADPLDPNFVTTAVSVSFALPAIVGGAAGGVAGLGLLTSALLAAGGATTFSAAGVVTTGGGVAVSFSALGGFAAGASAILLTQGVLMSSLGITYAIQTGSLEQGFRMMYDHFAKPTGERYDVTRLLVPSADPPDDGGDLPPEDGVAGGRGHFGTAGGAGVYATTDGEVRMDRTIAADNQTITPAPNSTFEALAEHQKRQRLDGYFLSLQGDLPDGSPPEPTVLTVRVGPGGTIGGRDEFTRFITLRYRNDDVAADLGPEGTFDSDGANFVAATTMTVFNQPLDQRGTSANPLELGSVGRLALNGGLTPTLKLRDDSPARRGGPGGSPGESSQNGYDRSGGLVDIGAWDGGVNRAPVAGGPIVFEMDEGGSLSLTVEDLLAKVSDPNGDGLVVTSVDLSGLRGTGSVSRSGNWVEAHSNVLVDRSGGLVIGLDYALSPDDPFSGFETFTFEVSDGVASTTVTATIRVLNTVNDPPTLRDLAFTTPEDQAIDIDLWELVDDPDTPSELLVFQVGGATNGTALLLEDGRTVRFVLDPDFNTDQAGQFASFTVTVTDPGDGVGPTHVVGPWTVSIAVTPVNDAPVIVVPGPVTAFEDVEQGIGGISAFDVDIDEGDGLIQVTLGVDHGTLTLGQVDGLEFLQGDGSGDRTMTFRGTLTDINAALAVLSYRGDLNYGGPDTLTILADDLGNHGEGGPKTAAGTVAIAVLSSQQQAALIVGMIDALVSGGVLNGGQGNALKVKLDLKGNPGDAGKIGSFLNQVRAFLNAGILHEEQAGPLLAAGDTLLISVATK